MSISFVNVKAQEESEDEFYGVVVFDGLVNYTSIYNGDVSFDATYGVDGAFLYEENDQVYFKINDDIGYIKNDEVEILSFAEIKNNISSYCVKDNILYHNIKTNINNNYYTYSLPIDDAPDYLNDNSIYYSYDGIYFYDEFEKMIDDYREEYYDDAINFDCPYYNYYLFLPVRSFTNITVEDLEKYFYDELKIKGKLNSYNDLSKDSANDVVNRSQIYGELNSFYAYEEIYGVNALRLLCDAINESSFGKSLNSYTNNNLYTSAAYDSNNERENNRYNNIDTSIYSHAKYFISRAFANNHYDYYKGSFLGNKASGVSVMYNLDPYNGEKVASNHYLIDSYFNHKDKNAYSIGIIENLDSLTVYADEELEEELFKLKNLKNYSLILLEEDDDYYKVQVDPSFSDEYRYDAQNCVGYIDSDEIDHIVGSDEIIEPTYKTVTYDFGEGELHNFSELSLTIPNTNIPVMVAPILNGYEVVGFNETQEGSETKYDAIYEEIHKVEIHSKAKEKNEYGKPYNLRNGSIKITFGNYNTKIVDYDTNNVVDFQDGKFVIDYAGFKLWQNANMSYDLILVQDEIKDIINRNIESFKNNGTYNIEELQKAKEDIKELGYELSFDEIRVLDEIFLEATREDVNYSFEKYDYDISVSGLALAMKEPGILNIFKPFKDTYFTRIGSVSSSNENIANNVAKAYGFEEVLSLKLSIQFNLRTAELESPIVVSVKIDDKPDYSTYTVYHVDINGDVKKCLCQQSDDYIQFMCQENGDYFIYRKDSFNDFDFLNHYENINIYNADADNHLLFINGSMLFTLGIVGSAIIVVHIILNRKQEKIWRDYKKYWQPAVSPQDVKPKN